MVFHISFLLLLLPITKPRRRRRREREEYERVSETYFWGRGRCLI